MTTIGFESWVFKFWNPKGRHMRIADLLMDSDDDFSGEIVVGSDSRSRRRRNVDPQCVGCLTPRFVLSRWFPSAARKSKGRKKGEEVERESIREVFDREAGGGEIKAAEEVGCSMSAANCESSSPCITGRYRKEDCFNMAVGFGLFYAIAASRKELDKMIELRAEVEALLQNVKEALQNQTREMLSKQSEPNEITACSPIGAQESLCSNCHVSLDTLFNNPTDSVSNELGDRSVTCHKTRQDKPIEGINHLESELEVELERLQTYLDTGEVSDCSKQQIDEVTVEDTAPEDSFGASFEEVSKPREEYTSGHYGVPPDLLARRLHELLESRQRERIEELEAALECANQNLFEKERELRWWKDTAHVISQRVPKNSRSIL